jgi:hypothetical protein
MPDSNPRRLLHRWTSARALMRLNSRVTRHHFTSA